MRYFDLHCDTLGHCAVNKLNMIETKNHVDLKNNDIDFYVQCFAVFVKDEIKGKAGFDRVLESYEYFKKISAQYPHLLKKCETKEDLEYCRKTKTCAGIFTIEGGSGIGDDINNLDIIRDMGVKAITLTWSGSTMLGDGVMVENAQGLTQYGKEVIRKMEEYGIIVDISHASDRLFYDVAAFATKPFIATHSNSRAVCSHPRNLTDEQFSIIRDRGGIVGLNFYRDFLDNDNEKANIDSIVNHADHFLSLGGENTLAMGSDFDGSTMPIGITGIESVGAIKEAFLRRNYSEELVDKIMFKNASEFFDRVM